MRARSTTIVLSGFAHYRLPLLSPGLLHAQAAPGLLGPPQSDDQAPVQRPQPVAKPKPRPQVPPRTTIAGSWKFNHDESDDAMQKARTVESTNTPNTNRTGVGYPGGGGYPGGYPYPGGGGPWGYPGGGGGGGPRNNRNEDIVDNPQMEPLLHPTESLSVDLKTPEVDMTDDAFHKLTLYTDGRQLPKSKDENNPQILAHWSGTQLVSDEKEPARRQDEPHLRAVARRPQSFSRPTPH